MAPGDLEDTIYAVFLRASGRLPSLRLTVARALGGITKKRVKEFAYQGGGYASASRNTMSLSRAVGMVAVGPGAIVKGTPTAH